MLHAFGMLLCYILMNVILKVRFDLTFYVGGDEGEAGGTGGGYKRRRR